MDRYAIAESGPRRPSAGHAGAACLGKALALSYKIVTHVVLTSVHLDSRRLPQIIRASAQRGGTPKPGFTNQNRNDLIRLPSSFSLATHESHAHAPATTPPPMRQVHPAALNCSS